MQESQKRNIQRKKPAPKKSTSAAGTGAKRRPMRTMEIKKVSAAASNRTVSRPTAMRRPKPRRGIAPVTAEFGKVRPRKRKKQTNAGVIRRSARQSIRTVRVRGAHLPWAVILSALSCTVVIMAMVFNYVRLNELTNQYQSLQNKTVELSSTRKTLVLALEQKNDLLTFEEEAVNSGMVKSDRVEKRYINLENGDKIEVPEGSGGTISENFSQIWEGIVRAFRNIFG